MPFKPRFKKYRLFIALTAISTFTLIAALVITIRSYWTSDKLYHSRWTLSPAAPGSTPVYSETAWFFTTGMGYLNIGLRQQYLVSSLPAHIPVRQWHWDTQPATGPIPHFLSYLQSPILRFLGIGYTYGQTGPTVVSPAYSTYSQAWGPSWLLLVFMSLFHVYLTRKTLQLYRESRPGLCPKCGYDLSHSPTACPECGEKPFPAPTP